MFYDRKKYTLYHADNEGVEVEEPLEWETDDRSFVRNKELHGIAINITDELTFIGDGKDYLSSILEDYGVNTDVRLLAEIRDTQTDEWRTNYDAYVDFETYSESDTEFKVKFDADPLLVRFKSKLKAKVELERLTDLKGDSIPPARIDTIYLDGRDILLTNKLTQNGSVDLRVSDNREKVVPLTIEEVGDKGAGIVNVQSPIVGVNRHGRTDVNNGYIEELFYGINDTGEPVTLNLNFSIKHSNYLIIEGTVTNIEFKIRVVIYSGNVNPLTYQREVLVGDLFNDSPDNFPKRFNITQYSEITLAVNESCTLEYYMKVTGTGYAGLTVAYLYSCPDDYNGIGGYLFGDDRVCSFINEVEEWEPSYNILGLTIQEDSQRHGSTSPMFTIFNFAKRLNDIILGEDFRSEILAEENIDGYVEAGELSEISLLHGMWARGLSNGADGYKPISTSLSDFFQSLNTIRPIGVDVYNNQMTIEGKEYFYQKHVSIELGEVTDFITSFDIKDHNSLITVGYEKSGGYEEDSGLDEYNRETQYSTILDKNTNELKLISKYRADMYGLESVRRDNPDVGRDVDLDKDSKFDDHIWFLDTNRVSGQSNLELSGWQKRFSQAPDGVYSPETATNIWLSPINILLRHGAWLKSPLLKYLDSWVRFTFSEGNSELITKLIGGNEYTQNIGIPVKDFERSENKAKIGKFKAPVTWEQLNGFTNGMRNVYGLVSLTYQSVAYKGHIIDVVQKNGIGEWEIKIFS